jgi:hypothetical protein
MPPTAPIRTVVAIWVLTAGVATDAAQQDAFDTTVHLGSRFESQVIRAAARGAHRALQQEKCQRILQELNDTDGRKLQERLEDGRQTAPQYFERLLFRSGEHLPSCAREGVLAVTTVGGRVIYACPALMSTWLRSPRLAQAILIHEMLHTLGMGENEAFPSSARITSYVERRCAGP